MKPKIVENFDALKHVSVGISLATRQRANSSYCKGAYKTLRGMEARIEHAPTYHQLVIIIAINSMNSNLIFVPWV